MLPSRYFRGMQWIHVLILLHCLHTATGTNYKCETLQHRKCLGSTLEYNFTTLQLVTDSSNQDEVQSNLEKWKGLKFLSNCWSVLQPLLCQVYMPECQADGSVRLPCREQCEATRKPCSVVERYHKKWPDFLQCANLKEGDCKVSS